MLKRIVLFLLTNLAVLLVISFLLSIFHVQPYLSAYGLDYQSLLIYAAIVGFSGSIISLFLSKFMAKTAYNVQVITEPRNNIEGFLFTIIESLAREMRINMPEVGIYDSPEPNAFATGWNKHNALVCVSTGLLNDMKQDELEAVLGHEMSHVANGDMVTLTLIQGVVNTFVIFFARIAAFVVTQFLRRNNDEESAGGGFVYYTVAMIFELLFGILATMIVMWFSRYREYRADAGSARYVGKYKMIRALQRLQQYINGPVDDRAPALNAFKISDRKGFIALFSSHPPLEDRIAALEKLNL